MTLQFLTKLYETSATSRVYYRLATLQNDSRATCVQKVTSLGAHKISISSLHSPSSIIKQCSLCGLIYKVTINSQRKTVTLPVGPRAQQILAFYNTSVHQRRSKLHRTNYDLDAVDNSQLNDFTNYSAVSLFYCIIRRVFPTTMAAKTTTVVHDCKVTKHSNGPRWDTGRKSEHFRISGIKITAADIPSKIMRAL